MGAVGIVSRGFYGLSVLPQPTIVRYVKVNGGLTAPTHGERNQGRRGSVLIASKVALRGLV